MRNFATVLFRPRATMARILEAPGARAVLLLFVLAALSGMVGDFDAQMLDDVLARSRQPYFVWLIAGILLGVLVLAVALLWFYSWVPYFIGRFLGGTGDVRGVRAALAWGLVPAIWALLYRLPAAIWFVPSASTSVRMAEGKVGFDPGRMADGCGILLVFAFLELIVLAWCAFVMSNTVAEAHKFSAWHGLGTLALSAIAPFVVGIAALLAFT
jgi:hypothetical protein